MKKVISLEDSDKFLYQRGYRQIKLFSYGRRRVILAKDSRNINVIIKRDYYMDSSL